MKPRVSRSRTGCYTCRRRKKKCDESSYPICNNCESKKLQCVWPDATKELYKKLGQVKYIDEEKKNKSKRKRTDNVSPQISIPIGQGTNILNNLEESSTTGNSPFDQFLPSPFSDFTDISESHLFPNKNSSDSITTIKSSSSINLQSQSQSQSHSLHCNKNHILNMIAMQQDCVQSDEEDFKYPQNQSLPIQSNFNSTSINRINHYSETVIPITTFNSTKSVRNKALHSAIALMESPRLETTESPVLNIDFTRLSSPEI
ncbi:uncharacterized protein RJT21DRAFT_120987 [Scheffersomyces amazonensis]|uniref:uncharacterized protein n=1 Tax=Scheffersomyces amazonensis TaxID=1078765 RepID=UPI00315D5DAD